MVSVVIANSLHREVVEGLLAAGKHVLCEKPLRDTLDDAAGDGGRRRRRAHGMCSPAIGFTFRRAPGIAFITQLVDNGELGTVLHFCGRYWTDYGCNPHGADELALPGPAGIRRAGRRRQPPHLRRRIPRRRRSKRSAAAR